MSKDWQYGDAGDRYPIPSPSHTPTLWSAGPHLFACGDLTNPAHYNNAFLAPARLTFIRIPLVYIDPPWTQSLLTGFRTKAKAPRSELTLRDFLYCMLEPLSTLLPQPMILMEGSTQPLAKKAVREAVGRIPTLSILHTWNITYYHTKPGLLYELAGDAPPFPLNGSFDGMDDTLTPAHAIEHFTSPGNFVLDPCLGRGLTAVACQTLSRRCIGMELNPRRLACALDTLHRDHDLRIETVGSLTNPAFAPTDD